MIKLQRISAPKELTSTVVKAKTDQFKADPTNHVWKEKYIVERLMRMSHNKCCYCECMLGIESKYMEVEHFHDKDQYPDEVVDWNNLLPSCKHCNGSKHTHDTKTNPIVNPSIDNPKDHLAYRYFRYEGKDSVGEETKEVLHLNDSEKKCLPRFLVCNELTQKLEDILVDIQSISKTSRDLVKKKATRKVTELLEACQCDREYTAIKATTLVNNPDYAKLISEMTSRGLWNPMLSRLDASMRKYVLDIV